MPLTAGTRLGPYEIVAPLGAGGMVLFIGRVLVAADNRSYVYQYSRSQHELYLAYDLR